MADAHVNVSLAKSASGSGPPPPPAWATQQVARTSGDDRHAAAAGPSVAARPVAAASASQSAAVWLAAAEVSIDRGGWEQLKDEASGHPYWWNRDTGETTWERPPRPPQAQDPVGLQFYENTVSVVPKAAGRVPTAGLTGVPEGSAQQRSSQGRRTSIGMKIDDMVSKLDSRIDPYILRPWKRVPPPPPTGDAYVPEPPPPPPWYSPRRWLLTFVGCVFYGILFVPFIFAILQQSAATSVAVSPFGDNVFLSRSSWAASFVFLTTVALYCMAVFNLELSQGAKAISIFLLMLLVWLQQALTWRYIQLRPDLNEPPLKNRGKKYHICGRAYSTMDPRSWVNYIQFSLIASEFFQFSSVGFQPYVGWRTTGSRDDDSWLLCAVQGFMREFVGYSVDEVLLALLVTFTTFYLLVLGEFVYSERNPESVAGAVVCEFFAGTCYVTVVTRLLGVADTVDDNNQRVVAVLALFVYTSTATFVATLRTGGKNAKENVQIRWLPKWLVLERILKGTLGIATVFCQYIPPLGSECEYAYQRSDKSVYEMDTCRNQTNLTATALVAGEQLRGQDYLDECGGTRLGAVVLMSYALLVNATHVFFLRRWKTCSVTFVTRARLGLCALAFYGQLVTLLMTLAPWAGWFLVLCIGGGLFIAALIGFAVYKICFAPPPDDETSEVKRDRLKKAHDKLMRKGYARGGAWGAVRGAVTVARKAPPPPPPVSEY